MFKPHPDLEATVGSSALYHPVFNYALKLTTSYAELVRRFGEPNDGDEYKVSSEWILIEESTGAIITIHDWKATELYDDDYPTLEKFRELPLYEWHVGGFYAPAALRFLEEFAANTPIPNPAPVPETVYTHSVAIESLGVTYDH